MDLHLIITLLILTGLLGLVAAQQLKTHPVDIARSWIVPVVISLLACTHLTGAIFNNPTAIAISLGALGLGLLSGLVRGYLDRVELTGKPRQLLIYASWRGLLVWLGFLVINFSLRFVVGGSSLAAHEDLGTLVPLLMTAGLLLGWRWQWQLNYGRLQRVPSV